MISKITAFVIMLETSRIKTSLAAATEASPIEASPMEASPMEASPMEASPIHAIVDGVKTNIDEFKGPAKKDGCFCIGGCFEDPAFSFRLSCCSDICVDKELKRTTLECDVHCKCYEHIIKVEQMERELSSNCGSYSENPRPRNASDPIIQQLRQENEKIVNKLRDELDNTKATLDIVTKLWVPLGLFVTSTLTALGVLCLFNWKKGIKGDATTVVQKNTWNQLDNASASETASEKASGTAPVLNLKSKEGNTNWNNVEDATSTRSGTSDSGPMAMMNPLNADSLPGVTHQLQQQQAPSCLVAGNVAARRDLREDAGSPSGRQRRWSEERNTSGNVPNLCKESNTNGNNNVEDMTSTSSEKSDSGPKAMKNISVPKVSVHNQGNSTLLASLRSESQHRIHLPVNNNPANSPITNNLANNRSPILQPNALNQHLLLQPLNTHFLPVTHQLQQQQQAPGCLAAGNIAARAVAAAVERGEKVACGH